MLRLMKKMPLMLIVFSLCLTGMPVHLLASAEETEKIEIQQGTEAEVVQMDVEGWPEPINITAETGVIMELSTAIVEYNKGRDEIRYIGELAKYMTILLACEYGNLEAEITFTETGVREVAEDRANIRAKEGEVLTLENCLYAVSLASANDAAAQLAEYIGGTEEKFIQMMNDRAAELGCINTKFFSVTGFQDEESYSTAYDMALIIRAGIKNETFRKVVSKTSYTIKKTNKSKKRKLASDIAIMDEESEEYYDRCRIAKTFGAEQTGYNMVLAAKKNDVTYIVVTLASPTEELCYEEGRALLDYAHDNFVKLEYKLGTLVWPKAASTDSVEVTGKTEGDMLIHRYYVGSWLVGKGSQALFPESEVNREADDESGEKLIYSDEKSDDEWEALEDDFEDVDDDEEEGSTEDGIDLVVKEKEEYFTIYGYSLTEWEHFGALIIITGAILIFIGTLIKIRWQAERRRKERARQRRLKRYEEPQENVQQSEEWDPYKDMAQKNDTLEE